MHETAPVHLAYAPNADADHPFSSIIWQIVELGLGVYLYSVDVP
jgi:hypothetical protein